MEKTSEQQLFFWDLKNVKNLDVIENKLHRAKILITLDYPEIIQTLEIDLSSMFSVKFQTPRFASITYVILQYTAYATWNKSEVNSRAVRA